MSTTPLYFIDNGEEYEDEVEDSDSSEDFEEESNQDGPEAEEGQEDLNAEKEIEGDFDRLVQDIRQRNDAGSGLLAKDWDITIEEQNAAFQDDLRTASGIGRKRKQPRGRVEGPALSHQVRSLIGDGNQAYVDNDLPGAIRIMQEVIKIEPRAASAWTVLAQCYDDMNQGQRALQLRIMAAHLRHDADEWYRLARQSRELGLAQQALYCYRKVYSLDPSNVDALWDRATLAKEVGDLRTSRHCYLTILKRFPHDLTVLGELRPILVELSDLATCTALFQNAFEHYRRLYPAGRGPGASSTVEIAGGGFGLMEVFVLADLYNTLGEYEKAIAVIRKGCRWLQGRGDQRYWDLCEDDREWDVPEIEVARSTTNGLIEPGRFPIDVNARHRLAISRIKSGEIEEGKMHASVVLGQDVLDYAPLFVEIADAYYERDLYAEALPIYELLGADANTSSLYILLQTASCLRMMDELREAAEVYEQVRLADPTHNDAKMKLAEIYEILNEPRRALELVYEVIDARRKRHKDARAAPEDAATSSGIGGSLFLEMQPPKKPERRAPDRLTQAQLRELEAEKEKEVTRWYKRLLEFSGDPEKEEEWLIEAEKLVEAYRETRNLFSTSRTHPFRGMFPSKKKKSVDDEAVEDRMVSRLQLDLENDTISRKSFKDKAAGVDIFRGVSFGNWLRLFMQYCFLLTQRKQFELAEEILRHMLLSNPYCNRESQTTIRLALITCAISAQQFGIVVEQCRKLIGMNQFNNEPFRILMASLASGFRPTDSFITSTLQKHLFREVKTFDLAVKSPESLKWSTVSKRYGMTTTSGKDEEDADEGAPADEHKSDDSSGRPDLPKKPNPLLVAVYGQICIAAKSYQSAIFYLLHAYDYCPDDPMICLCLAIASIGRAMQRQADNRHHLVAQAMAFLSRYRVLRGTDWDGMGEVEFNFARCFHQLGLLSHAVRHYEHVLELAERSITKDGGLAREAAYNLSLIYVMTGATPLADLLYRRWLSF